MNPYDEDVATSDHSSPRMVKLRAVSKQILLQAVEQRILQPGIETDFFVG